MDVKKNEKEVILNWRVGTNTLGVERLVITALGWTGYHSTGGASGAGDVGHRSAGAGRLGAGGASGCRRRGAGGSQR